jgi:flagellar basal body-associated protein FliL
MDKGKLMMIIIIVLLVVILGTVGAVAFYVMNMMNSQTAAIEEGTNGVTVSKKLDIQDLQSVSVGGEIITNLTKGADNLQHTAKIGVNFRYDKTVEKESEAFTTLLTEPGILEYARSVALGCINDCTYEDLYVNDDGAAFLADLIKTRLQEEFNTTLIVDVYFNEWTII